jgi:hypothetical protein
MIEVYRVWAYKGPKDGIAIGIDAADEVEKKVYSTSPKFVERELYSTDGIQKMCEITDGQAVDLMDDLWKIGIRPTQEAS